MVALPSDFLVAEKLLAHVSVDSSSLYERVVEAARRLVAADAFYLCLVDQQGERLDFVYLSDGDMYGPGDRLPIGDGPTSRVARTGRPIVLNDEASGAVFQANPFGSDKRSSSAVHWPLHIDRRGEGLPDGVLSVQSYASKAFDSESLAAIEWLALRTASALRDAAPSSS